MQPENISSPAPVVACNNRVLVIDDTESIHQDFRKTLVLAAAAGEVDAIEAALFGSPAPTGGNKRMDFVVDSAMQGQEGLDRVREAAVAGRPYAMAFVDMRMPPGWDGVQTIEQLWKVDPDLQVVICTAHSDYILAADRQSLRTLGSAADPQEAL